jgi:hypothetical protein
MSAHELEGCYDIVYSPDDGGYYADLLWNRKASCPIYPTRAKADAWARKRGGTRCLRG